MEGGLPLDPGGSTMDQSVPGKRVREADGSSSPPRQRMATQPLEGTEAAESLPMAAQIESAFTFGSPVARFIVKAVDGRIPGRLPHVLKKDLSRTLPSIDALTGLRYTREGNVILSTTSKVCALNIAALREIGQCRVRPELFTDSISRRGVVGGLPPEIPLREILQELNERRIEVLRIRRLMSMREGVRVPTASVVCTFLGSSIPDYVTLWYERHQVRVYEERPQMCSRCLSYGHIVKFCRGSAKCGSCGSSHPEEMECTASTRCFHCEDPHHRHFQSCCPRYRREQEILRAKAAWGVSYQEARSRLRSQDTRSSYSSVVAGGNPAPPAAHSREDIATIVGAAVESAFARFFKEFQSFFRELWQSAMSGGMPSYGGVCASSPPPPQADIPAKVVYQPPPQPPVSPRATRSSDSRSRACSPRVAFTPSPPVQDFTPVDKRRKSRKGKGSPDGPDRARQN